MQALVHAVLGLAVLALPAAQDASPPVRGEAVLRVDGKPYTARELEAWLLRERGEILAPFHARYLLARRAAEAAGVRLPTAAVREAVESEVFERLRHAFGGDRDRWAAELAEAGRTPAGRMAERAIELEASLLVAELARRKGVGVAALEADLAADLEIVVEPAMTAADGRPEDIVLRVGDAAVTRRAYGRWLRLYRGEVEARRFAESCVLAETTRAAGIEVSDEEVAARVRADTAEFVASFYGGDWDMWRRKLAEERRTEEEHYRLARTPTRRALLLERLVASRRTVTEEDVRALWTERYGPEGRLVRLRWMFVRARLPEPTDATEEELERLHAAAFEAARARALDLRARVVEGGQDFAALAERSDASPAAWPVERRPAEGVPPSSLPPELAEALAPLAPGDVCEPVRGDGGWYLLELLGRERFPFDAVRASLARELADRPVTALEAQRMQFELVHDLAIEVLPAMFE